MTRQGQKLTPLKVAKLKTPGFYGDGHGLWLKVTDTGTKSWVLRYMLNGKAVAMGLGPVHTVSLQEARNRAREYRQVLLEGKDPLTIKREAIAAEKLAAATSKTFKEIAIEFLDSNNVQAFKNDKHRKQWKATLENHAFPVIGHLPLTMIDTATVLRVIKPVWERTPETASRLRGRIERVFHYAAPLGYFAGENPAQWKLLKGHLPKRGKANHHTAMPVSELPAFMAKLRDKDSLSAKALEFTVLCAARTNETIGMQWNEIDFTKKTWTIPSDRMKAGVQHTVPLSDRAIAVLASVPRNGSALVFPLSNMAMLELLKGTNGNGYTVHGFRSTFRDWAGDYTSYPRDLIEMALAHTVESKVEAAYRRSTALEKRGRLMQEWGRFCESSAITSATVTPINKTR